MTLITRCTALNIHQEIAGGVLLEHRGRDAEVPNQRGVPTTVAHVCCWRTTEFSILIVSFAVWRKTPERREMWSIVSPLFLFVVFCRSKLFFFFFAFSSLRRCDRPIGIDCNGRPSTRTEMVDAKHSEKLKLSSTNANECRNHLFIPTSGKRGSLSYSLVRQENRITQDITVCQWRSSTPMLRWCRRRSHDDAHSLHWNQLSGHSNRQSSSKN